MGPESKKRAPGGATTGPGGASSARDLRRVQVKVFEDLLDPGDGRPGIGAEVAEPAPLLELHEGAAATAAGEPELAGERLEAEPADGGHDRERAVALAARAPEVAAATAGRPCSFAP
jgi:hypothetical protein